MRYSQKDIKEADEWVVKNRSYENMAREVEERYFKLLETYNKRCYTQHRQKLRFLSAES